MNENHLKIVWICHFTNKEVQSLLPIWKYRDEMAPWIPNLLKGFENREDVEIHIISPHEYLNTTTTFKLRNIHYYFVPYGIPLYHRHWPSFFRFDVFFNFYFFRAKIKKIVSNIKPDLINLFGAENSYYSSSILDFKHSYPVLILIQGFISEFKDEPKKSLELRNRIKIEEKILKSFINFAGEQDSSTYISTLNPNHIFFRLYFPVNEIFVSNTKDTEKKFDCIYFGRLEKSKGSEDFIRVVAEIKRVKSDVRACIIGTGNLGPLETLAEELFCKDNIEFVGFVKSQKELFEYVKSSRVFLAPPYKERLSSTIREAMLLKVPIVAYATGGIPYINEFDENIYLVETGDYKKMAMKTLLLLQDEKRSNLLSDKAYKYCINEYSCKINTERLLSANYTILNNNK